MQAMIELIQNNGGLLLEALGAVVMLALIVARITPNETDNKVVLKVIKIANSLGLNFKGMKTLQEYEEKLKEKKETK